jgi:hypothetical protein
MQPRSVKYAFLALALSAFAAPGVRAQDSGFAAAPTGGLASPGAGPSDVGLAAYAGNAPRADQGLAIGPWLVYPSFFAGYTFNDNVYATKNNRVGLSSLTLSPSLEAGMDNGLWKTNVSFGASAFFYPGAGGQTRTDYALATSANDAPPSNATGHLSVSESWLPKADWAVTATGNFYRTQGLFGASSATNGFGLGTPGVTESAFNPSFIPTIGTFSSQQQYTNMYGGQFSVQKTINERTSLSGSVFVQGVSYDSAPSYTQYQAGVPNNLGGSSGPDGMSYGASTRGSFYATPQIYVFVQPTVSFQRFDNYQDNSNGYSANVGVGSNLIGLFQGEIFGGYQSQSSVYGYFGTQSAPSFGAHIRYLPTPRLTLSLNFQQVLGALASAASGATPTPTAPNANAGVGLTQQVYAAADYGLNSYMNLSVRGGWGQTQNRGGASYTGSSFAGSAFAGSAFAGSNISTQIWSGTASLSYNFWRNTSISTSYTFTKTTNSGESALLPSNSSLAPGYTQNLFTAGIRYSY